MSAPKRCTGCGRTKPLSEFHRHKHHSTGRRAQCKTCTNGNEKQVKAVCVSCPNDEEIGVPIFWPRASFGRTDFRDMVFRGYLPYGSVWLWASRLGDPPIQWRADGDRLREVDGIRTLKYTYREVIR